MNNKQLQRYLIFSLALVILWACNDDEGNIGVPTVVIEAPEAVKPDSTIELEVMVNAPGLLAADGIQGTLTSGTGDLERISLQGENTSSGNALFEFTAGNTENTTATISITASDQSGQQGSAELEISITSLEVKQVLVLNEGNFFSANGTIDVFDVSTGMVEISAYQAVATVQQASKHEENYYLVTNAPDALKVLNEELSLIGSVEQGFDNPVDFAAIGSQGYVSNWGDINTAFTDNPDAYIAIVDITSSLVIDSVELSKRPQGLIAHEGKLFIANEGGSSVSVLDPGTLVLTEIDVPAGPSEFVIDSFGSLWVICTSGSLVEIDPVTMETGVTIDDLVTSGFNEKMAINGSGNRIYFLGGSNDSFTGLTTVYQVDLSSMEVTALIQNGFAFYGIGVNPESNEIYLGDSNAFQSTGTGFRYDAEGNLLDEFATGIGPRGFLF